MTFLFNFFKFSVCVHAHEQMLMHVCRGVHVKINRQPWVPVLPSILFEIGALVVQLLYMSG